MFSAAAEERRGVRRLGFECTALCNETPRCACAIRDVRVPSGCVNVCVNLQQQDGSAPIHYASRQGHVACLDLLQSKGAKLDAKRYDGITPLMCAAQSNRLECLRLLLARGADATLTEKFGASALNFASRMGHVDCVGQLIGGAAELQPYDLRVATRATHSRVTSEYISVS